MNYLNPMNLFRFFSRFTIGTSKLNHIKEVLTQQAILFLKDLTLDILSLLIPALKLPKHLLYSTMILLAKGLCRTIKYISIDYMPNSKVIPFMTEIALDILSLLFTALELPKHLRFSAIILLAKRSCAAIKSISIAYIPNNKVIPFLTELALDILSLLFTARVLPKIMLLSPISTLAKKAYGPIKDVFTTYMPNSVVSKAFSYYEQFITKVFNYDFDQFITDYEQFLSDCAQFLSDCAQFTTRVFNSLKTSFKEANEQANNQASKRVRESLQPFRKTEYSKRFDELWNEQDLSKCKTTIELQDLKERVKTQATAYADRALIINGANSFLMLSYFYTLKNLVISPAAEPQIEQPVLVGCLTQVPAPAKQGYESLSNNDKFMLWSRPAEKIVATKEQEANAHELRIAKFAYGMR